MKIIVTLFQESNACELLEYADGIIIGNERFGARLCKSFSEEEINRLISLANKKNKDVYLNANQLFDDRMIRDFQDFLAKIDVAGLSGIVVADLGLVEAVEQKSLLVYNPETLLTNAYDFNMLENEKVKGAFVAKEITKEDIMKIGHMKAYELFMVGHGHLNMFYSKRQLIDTYKTYYKIPEVLHNRQDLHVREEQRNEEAYPIFEDHAGTHVFRSKVLSTIRHLEELSDVLDHLIIDTIFKDDAYGLRILKLYRHPDDTLFAKLQEDYDETWDEGFLFQKTIYKNEV